jgi:threonine dehydrogenase-like Zn-dependent dehydrogenase
MPSLLTLSDIMRTGHHAAVTARVARGHSVAGGGDGAVGLCSVIAAKRLGAEQIIIMGRQNLVLYRSALAGSNTGGIHETQDMVDVCALNNIKPEITKISINGIDDA